MRHTCLIDPRSTKVERETTPASKPGKPGKRWHAARLDLYLATTRSPDDSPALRDAQITAPGNNLPASH